MRGGNGRAGLLYAGLALATGLGLGLTSAAAEIAAATPPPALHGDLQVWGWNIAAASLDKLVPGFNALYPGVAVRVNTTGANLQARFLLSLSAGVGAPDVSQLQLAEAPRYAMTRRLTDLTAAAAKYADDFPDSFWDNCVFEGRVYAIPWDMGPCGVFYKREVFARYQIDPERIETWDDFVAAGRQILEGSGGATKMLVLPTGSMEYIFEILLQQNGGQVFDAEGRVVVRSQQTREVLDVLKKIIDAGIYMSAAPLSHAYYAAIRSETTATFVSAAWWGGTIQDYAPEMAGKWGVFRLPAFRPGGLRTSNQGGSVLVIPEQCAQKEAAWAYIEYALCTRDAQIAQYRNYGLFPALLPTHADPFFDAPDPYYGGQPVRRLFTRDIERIAPLHRTKDWFEAMRYIAQALSGWVEDGMGDPDVFLQKLEQRLALRLGREIAGERAHE